MSAARQLPGEAGPIGRLVADMEVDAGGDAEAVLNVLRAVGEARVDEVHFHDTEIEAVIDVEIDATAALEVERGGVTGEDAFDRVLAGCREGVAEFALDEDGALAVPGCRADVADVVGVARTDEEGDGVDVDRAAQVGARGARAAGDEADSLPRSIGDLGGRTAEIEVGVGLVADETRGILNEHHAEVAAGLGMRAGGRKQREDTRQQQEPAAQAAGVAAGSGGTRVHCGGGLQSLLDGEGYLHGVGQGAGGSCHGEGVGFRHQAVVAGGLVGKTAAEADCSRKPVGRSRSASNAGALLREDGCAGLAGCRSEEVSGGALTVRTIGVTPAAAGTLTGLNEPEPPLGRPATVSATGAASEFAPMGETTRLYCVLAPRMIEAELAEPVASTSEKSSTTCVSGAEVAGW